MSDFIVQIHRLRPVGADTWSEWRMGTANLTPASGLEWEDVEISEIECPVCDGLGMVCENHKDRPWGVDSNREDACECGAGAPCLRCSPDASIYAGTGKVLVKMVGFVNSSVNIHPNKDHNTAYGMAMRLVDLDRDSGENAAIILEAILNERERCARIIEALGDKSNNPYSFNSFPLAKDAATLIRVGGVMGDFIKAEEWRLRSKPHGAQPSGEAS